MYLPRLHAETDPRVIDAFIRANGFATLVTAGDAYDVTHLPLELVAGADGQRTIEGHVSRANAHWRALERGTRTLAIFAGPHAYVSPTWYDHENVPTWNYMVVHATGTPGLVTDPGELRDMLTRLSEHYEPAGAPPPRFAVEQMTPALYQSEARGIVGFRLAVDTLEAKFKLSQNRQQRDHAEIIRRLRQRGDDDSAAIAEAMAGQHKQRYGTEP